MINESKKSDFFPASEVQLKDLTVSYQDTEEDISHEAYLRELEAVIFEDSNAKSDDELGELPYNEDADRQRWDELEQDFDRIFDEAKNIHY